MLEAVLTSAVTALLVSVGAVFVMEWGTRMHVRRIRFDLDDVLDKLMRDDRRRAAAVALARRSAEPAALNPLDAALIAKHVASASPGGAHSAEPVAWFDALVARKKPAPPGT